MRAGSSFPWIVAAAMAALSLPARATATLDASVVSATCSLTTSEGTTSVPCQPQGWSVMLQPGWSAQMVATITYDYADDGLPLDRPGGFQLDSSGLFMRFVDHEAGAVYVQTSHLTCRYSSCQPPPGLEFTGWGFGPFIVSDNDVPDRVSGSFVVTTGAINVSDPQYAMSFSPTIYVSEFEMAFSGVPAIPEPGTWVLMAAGLAGLALWRRRAPTAPPAARA